MVKTMQLELLSFLVLMFLYFAHNFLLQIYFKRKFNLNDNFLGKNAPNDMQLFFRKALYLVIVYYVLILVYLSTGFNFWGLISNITIINSPVIVMVSLILGIVFIVLMTLARLNLGSSWRMGLDYDLKMS